MKKCEYVQDDRCNNPNITAQDFAELRFEQQLSWERHNKDCSICEFCSKYSPIEEERIEVSYATSRNRKED